MKEPQWYATVTHRISLSLLCTALLTIVAVGSAQAVPRDPGRALTARAGAMMTDPAAPGVRYAIEGGVLWRSRDSGAHWQPSGPTGGSAPVGEGAPASAVARWVAAGHGGRDGAALLYGCACGGALAGDATSVLYLLQGSGLYRSFNQGESWSRMAVAGVRADELASLRLDPNNDGKLYARKGDGTLLRSLDAGYSWGVWHDDAAADGGR